MRLPHHIGMPGGGLKGCINEDNPFSPMAAAVILAVMVMLTAVGPIGGFVAPADKTVFICLSGISVLKNAFRSSRFQAGKSGILKFVTDIE
ncbi:hypothetical protein B2D07_08185 [Desulfococcus multivorans]|uniref:Uncharacterized protein n=1 Tax=Desulfococcus multivorans DSM 2059 TaxID=1121405 RepID=S7V945_DESML|nr:uncharacterized protein Dmul_16520 [Desulfococcus multivorans]AQV00748.1 hypothetical protein B2D07_08185 [Desulfococcus multivorans]EPR43214.1 hypothetical protein dsmv_1240 [Desulfococcus multivorans DSM 2059]SJZ40398.1 hypothetical protein SAMN02745446_00356 [Desulfococcus multivorans DSM 2059]